MASLPTKTISAIVSSEGVLELIINKLTEKTVARHDISVQGSPAAVASEYGEAYVGPEEIQKSSHPPKRESFLRDDFGWVIGFSFAIPVFICVVIGVFLIGDVRSPSDNLFYGLLGAIIGAISGALLAKFVRNHQIEQIRKQERKGGFVLWITVTTDEQMDEAIKILEGYHARQIQVT
ncbi:Uncharacterised protein [Legionella lansingensis]|uniref:Transmembrane protein n=1 Tax=Legionella lansingensis TaxID=45067 RepID=A0A0W0VPH0_9GAMM|nr:AtpZ/AtpI family protein [Legionella lansingensis]KTD22020.1 hypothetical protein Llan_1283 [Legionella lansingensis]SNV54009.1 Uncharacterised protein [Legionella lansingensis]